MKYVVALLVVAVSISISGQIAAQTPKKKPKKAGGQRVGSTALAIADLEVGKSGYLTFPALPGRPLALLPLKVENVDGGQFIGSLTSSATGKRTLVIVRRVTTDGLVSGRFLQLDGEVTVTATEEVSTGEAVFVLEPTDPSSFTLKKSESPELERPR